MAESSGENAFVRVGILGAARIAHKNVIAILNDESSCIVTAVASRSELKAKKFVDENIYSLKSNKMPKDVAIFGGDSAYDDLCSSSVCDALYIPLPTSLHKEWVEKALRGGKHVLLEKPVSVAISDFAEMRSLAYECGKYLQDGTMFSHSQRTRELIDAVADTDVVGTVTRIEASFCFGANEEFFGNDIRTKADGDPLGCIGDVGWYCVRLALLVFGKLGYGKPTRAVTFDATLNEEGVPVDATCFVAFQEGRKLFFHCGFTTPLVQTADIVGTKKRLRIDDFVLPTTNPMGYDLLSMDMFGPSVETKLDREHVPCQSEIVQEVAMWKKFAEISQALDASTDKVVAADAWHGGGRPEIEEAHRLVELTYQNQRIINALMESASHGGVAVDL